ncbi:hypothetical protein N4R57_18285 [Rhodobacteraceae bacterium D3-12]|nr:hypothetical protein N4R57_18285 [Rhodobacteraceae bacterium D3-12]
MSDLSVTKTRMKDGIWEAVLHRPKEDEHAELPKIEVTLDTTPIDGVEVTANQDGAYILRVPVPKEAIGDGVQTFLVKDGESGDLLERFAVIAGEAVEGDLRAEIDLLRAELDMLKKAFRRHCLETM